MNKSQGANGHVAAIITPIDFVLCALKIRYDWPVICQYELG